MSLYLGQTKITPIVLEESGVVNVEENDVNFYDYDGTVVASYSASDFANLNTLPSNPEHTGLTAQGWNWSLSDAKTYVATYGKLNIGQMYVTDDGKTRIYITLRDGRLEPYLSFAVNGTVTVDWGDGNTQTITGSSTSTVIYTQHTYSSAGDYVIKLTSSSTIYLIGKSRSAGIINKNNSAPVYNKVYTNGVIKIELGSNISIGDSAFYGFNGLTSISVPNSITSIGSYAFSQCNSLTSISVPNSITSIGSYAFSQCDTLTSISVPNSITSIETYAFSYCYLLTNIFIPNSVTNIKGNIFFSNNYLVCIIIPNSVTSIENYAFSTCYGMVYYDFSNFTSIPTLSGTSVFINIPSDCKIIVPDALYDTWIAATNWSTYASYIIKKTDWEAL